MYFLLKVMGNFGKILSIGAAWFQKDPLGCIIKNNLSMCMGGEGLGGERRQTRMEGGRTVTRKEKAISILRPELKGREGIGFRRGEGWRVYKTWCVMRCDGERGDRG